jgi:hypothetical protein
MPGVHQPDPPGLIHDDLRLLPPWRGSSLFQGVFRIADKSTILPRLRNVVFVSWQTPFIPIFGFIHRLRDDAGVVSVTGRRVGWWPQQSRSLR